VTVAIVYFFMIKEDTCLTTFIVLCLRQYRQNRAHRRYNHTPVGLSRAHICDRNRTLTSLIFYPHVYQQSNEPHLPFTPQQGTKACRYNWHSAGSVGWPFPMQKYKNIFQIKYTEAILSNITRKPLWFQISKMLIAVGLGGWLHTRSECGRPFLYS